MKTEHRSMETLTTFQNISGSVYIRIPPEFVEHMQLDKDKLPQGRIRTEVNKKGQPYSSVWVEGK